MPRPANPTTPEARVLTEALAARPEVTQAALADAINVSPGFISQFASGHRPVPWNKAERIAELVGVSPASISADYRVVSGHFRASQLLEPSLDTMRSAIVSVKEAVRALDLEMDVYDVAPLIAFAYRERAKLPPKLSKAQLAEFDAAVESELRGELAHERPGSIAPSSTRSPAKAPAKRPKAGASR